MDERVAVLISQLLTSSDTDARWRAAEALGKILRKTGDASAVELLIRALKSKSGDQVAVANALGKIGDTRAVEPLIEVLGVKDDAYRYYVGHEAIAALGSIGDKRAVEPLVCILVHSSYYIWSHYTRKTAAEALEKMGWVPRNDTEKAYFLIAKQDWDGVVAIGSPSIKPLIQVVTYRDVDSSILNDATKALGEIGT